MTVDELNGNGSISADGGPASHTGVSGGGAGGRIAIYYDMNDFAGTVSAIVGSGGQRGGAGTIYTKDASETYGEVVIDSGGVSGNVTPCLRRSGLAVWFRVERFQCDGRLYERRDHAGQIGHG